MPREAPVTRAIFPGSVFITAATSIFDADFDGVDSVRVKREVLADRRYGGVRSLVSPDRVDRAFAAGRNAVVGAFALVGTIRLMRCSLQLCLVDVLARDV